MKGSETSKPLSRHPEYTIGLQNGFTSTFYCDVWSNSTTLCGKSNFQFPERNILASTNIFIGMLSSRRPTYERAPYY